jgi:hypothetical protein
VIDTDTSDFVVPRPTPELCVLGHDDRDPSVLGARGGRPLVLLATDAFVQSGLLDVGSHPDPALVGPGGNSIACTTSTDGTNNIGGGGGGAGGGAGSPGGDGASGQNGAVEGGVAGAAIGSRGVLRGGCRGGNGGQGGGGATGGGVPAAARSTS